jgi:nitrate/nitrite transport system permease protein
MGLAKLKPVEPVVAIPIAATIHSLSIPMRPHFNWIALGASIFKNVVPPLIVTLVLLIIWQVACSHPGASLPPPTQVYTEAYDLIVSPFFNFGDQDIGLGWRVLVSLERVAIGFGIAAIVGVLIGAVIGQSEWAMRGLDPVFQVLRTVPPLAWLPLSLAAFRDSNPSAIFVIHHIGLARHHQHRCWRAQHPSRLSQCRKSAAPQPARILL